jgi:DNA-binding FrmR family transcriptional regulator
MKKSKQQLIRNIIGQLQGVDKMLETKQDCFAILAQMKAVKASMETIINRHLEEEMIKCIGKCSRDKEDHCNRVLKELIKNN